MRDPLKPFGPKWGGRVDPNKRVSPIVAGPPTPPLQGPRKAKFVPHGGTAREQHQYTGDNLLGIGVRHKSGLEPVFSAEQATDLAKMRRG